jgi:hypothetical protein
VAESIVELYTNRLENDHDVIPNNVKLKNHRIPGTQSPNCLESHVLDTNAHRIKRCEFSLLSWEWLKQRFNRNLNLDVYDPEEVLTRCSGLNGKAGLWFLLGVVHYNMKNYKAGSITVIFRKITWLGLYYWFIRGHIYSGWFNAVLLMRMRVCICIDCINQ